LGWSWCNLAGRSAGLAERPRRAELDTTGARPGRKHSLDALVAEASQQSLKQGPIDRADNIRGSASQAMERAVPQPQGVGTPTLRFIAVPLEHLAGNGEGPFGSQPPERSPLAVASTELLAPGRGDPGGGDKRRLVGGCLGDGVDQELADQLVVAFGDGDPQFQVGGLIDLGTAPNFRWSTYGRLGSGPEQPGGDQLVEVEGGQTAGDADGGGRLVTADRMPVSDQAVQAAPELVGQQGRDSQVGGCLRIGHVARVTAGNRDETR
jgi:hypothetical protein